MTEPIEVPGTSDPKPGVRTSEFWLTLLTAVVGVLGQVQGAIPEPWGTVTAAVVTAAYTIARALLKK